MKPGETRDTGWRVWAGEYGPKQGFQLVPNDLSPIIWFGDQPPSIADAHAYQIWEGEGVIRLHLHWENPGLKCGGFPVGVSVDQIIPSDHRAYKNLKLKMRLMK